MPSAMEPQGLPAEIASGLEPGEAVEAVFPMGDGLEIYATGRRFFCRRGDLVIGVPYADVAEVKRRAPLGAWRIVVGIGFLTAGAVMGFENPLAVILSLQLFLVGGVFLYLGIFRRRAWVELGIRREEEKPSFSFLALFIPFLLFVRRPGKRYKAPGSPAEVEALFEFLSARTRPPSREGDVAVEEAFPLGEHRPEHERPEQDRRQQSGR